MSGWSAGSGIFPEGKQQGSSGLYHQIIVKFIKGGASLARINQTLKIPAVNKT